MKKIKCLWCGKNYEEHMDKPLKNATPRVPCLLLKSGFFIKPKDAPKSNILDGDFSSSLLMEEFEEKLNMYDMYSDAIDDDNKMFKDLIKVCRELLKQLNEKTN